MSQERLAVAAVVAFAASELIGLNPRWKSNSVLQVVMALLLRALAPYKPKR